MRHSAAADSDALHGRLGNSSLSWPMRGPEHCRRPSAHSSNDNHLVYPPVLVRINNLRSVTLQRAAAIAELSSRSSSRPARRRPGTAFGASCRSRRQQQMAAAAPRPVALRRMTAAVRKRRSSGGSAGGIARPTCRRPCSQTPQRRLRGSAAETPRRRRKMMMS